MKLFWLKKLSLIKIFFFNIQDTLISIIRIIIDTKVSLTFKKNSNIVIATSPDCVLLVNGPSLNIDLKENAWILNEKDILCVNNFATSELYTQIKPKYYMFSDPSYWGEKPGEFLLNYRSKIFESIKDKTNWDMVLYHPPGAGKIIKEYIINKNNKVSTFEFNQTSILGFKTFREFCYKNNFGTPPPGNILIPALINMINLGYKYIYIAGTDHTMFKNISVGEDNVLYKESDHFYGKSKKRKLYSHSYLNGMVNDQVGLKMSEWLLNAVNVFLSHEIIYEYSKSLNADIINLTKNSLIDSYTKK